MPEAESLYKAGKIPRPDWKSLAMQVMDSMPESTRFDNLFKTVVNFHCKLVQFLFLMFTSLCSCHSFIHIQ